MAIVISNKIHFKMKTVITKKEWQFTKIKEYILSENITVLDINSPNNKATKYLEQKLTKIKGYVDT